MTNLPMIFLTAYQNFNHVNLSIAFMFRLREKNIRLSMVLSVYLETNKILGYLVVIYFSSLIAARRAVSLVMVQDCEGGANGSNR